VAEIIGIDQKSLLRWIVTNLPFNIKQYNDSRRNRYK